MSAVRLAPLGPEHAAAMFAWMSDPEVRANVGVRGEPSLERTEAWIARAETDPTIRAFAITESVRHVGNVALDHIDAAARNARLSIYLGEARDRGRGVGGKALRLALAEAFGPLGLHKVWLTVHAENAAAIGAYAAAGFRTEGLLREEFPLRGRLADAVRMGVLASEFAARAA